MYEDNPFIKEGAGAPPPRPVPPVDNRPARPMVTPSFASDPNGRIHRMERPVEARPTVSLDNTEFYSAARVDRKDTQAKTIEKITKLDREEKLNNRQIAIDKKLAEQKQDISTKIGWLYKSMARRTALLVVLILLIGLGAVGYGVISNDRNSQFDQYVEQLRQQGLIDRDTTVYRDGTSLMINDRGSWRQISWKEAVELMMSEGGLDYYIKNSDSSKNDSTKTDDNQPVPPSTGGSRGNSQPTSSPANNAGNNSKPSGSVVDYK